MDRTGRAIAIFRTKVQGPEISRRVREFSSRMPKVDFRVAAPSSLDGDISIKTFARTLAEAGMNAVLEASEPGTPSVIVAGQLRALLTLMMSDLVETPYTIIYKERGEYKIIS